MKKSTIIILFVVFLGSVLIVGVFGLQSIPYKELVYVKGIEITELTYFDGVSNVSIPAEEIKTNSMGERYISIPYNEGLSVYVNARCTPNDATNKHLRITVESNSTEQIAQVNDQGFIQFNQAGTIIVTMRATDRASAPSVTLRIRVTQPKELSE